MHHPKTLPLFKGESAQREGVMQEAHGQGRLNNLPYLKTFRKELRKNMTPAEAKLWSYLKNRQFENRKFRRQHSFGNYILDFYCPEERLAIELDGEVHNSEEAQIRDGERDLFLQYFGVQVLRFENKLVFQNPEALLEAIKSSFDSNNN